MNFQGLRVEVAGRIARVTIDHPPLNLLDAVLLRELSRLARRLAELGDDVRVVVIDSADPEFFVAHLDVGMLSTIGDDPEASVGSFQDLMGRYRALPQVTIAKIAGRLAGGASEWILNLDMRFAVRGRAVFNQVETGLGIVPAGSGSQLLPALMGRARALEVILGHDDVDAETAQLYGWVNRTLDADACDAVVERLATRIADLPLALIAGVKRAVDAGAPDLGPGLATERAVIAEAVTDPYARQRIAAFLAAGGQTRAGEVSLGELVGPGHVRQ